MVQFPDCTCVQSAAVVHRHRRHRHLKRRRASGSLSLRTGNGGNNPPILREASSLAVAIENRPKNSAHAMVLPNLSR